MRRIRLVIRLAFRLSLLVATVIRRESLSLSKAFNYCCQNVCEMYGIEKEMTKIGDTTV